MKIVLLSAGTGGRKLLKGFSQHVGQESLATIVNTGDDFIHLGLYVSPDVDSILYQLSGVLDEDRGWGRSDDAFNFLNEVGRLGGETWFQIGDKDLAMHIMRTALLNQGLSLTEVTSELAGRLGVKSLVLPMSNDRLQTKLVTDMGVLTFNEYLVRERGLPRVEHALYHGSERANPSPGVLESISHADLVVIGPSNPVAGIGPIVSIQAIRKALGRCREKVVVVSPIVGDRAVSGPSGRLMEAEGIEVSVLGVAELYSDIASKVYVHSTDSHYMKLAAKFHIQMVATNILMKDHQDSTRLAEEILVVRS